MGELNPGDTRRGRKSTGQEHVGASPNTHTASPFWDDGLCGSKILFMGDKPPSGTGLGWVTSEDPSQPPHRGDITKCIRKCAPPLFGAKQEDPGWEDTGFSGRCLPCLGSPEVPSSPKYSGILCAWLDLKDSRVTA